MRLLLRLLLVVMFLAWTMPAWGQQRAPGQHVQISAMMRDMRDFLSPGLIEGSLYNEHATKVIRIAEVTVTSSGGNRVFRFDCTIGPREVTEFRLSTGLRLDFREKGKASWGFIVSRAAWANSDASVSKRCPEDDASTR